MLDRLDSDGIIFLHRFYMFDEKFQLYMCGRCLDYVYVLYILIRMMVSLEGLVLYLLCVKNGEFSKRNAVEILNDHSMNVICIFA